MTMPLSADTPSRDQILATLRQMPAPGGGDLVSRDLIRALNIQNGKVSFVIETESPEAARALQPVQGQIEAAIRALPGVQGVQVMLTAHGPAAKPAPQAPQAASKGEPPQGLKIGGHAAPHQGGPARVPGIDRILAIGSGKGGVGKSTLSSNLAVALARAGRRVGLLDADIYGPSQPRMMGISRRPASPDGKTLIPIEAHGVKVMSIGLLLAENEALIWRGPMLMGALQQLLGQVAWGDLDVLIIDLPPGTGDVQLSLCQRTELTGTIIVSTPQDVALLDARRAIDMFQKLKAPILGLVENMSTYICPNCGHEAHLFGHGGVATAAMDLGLPYLGEVPLDLSVRLGGDAGQPVALGDGPIPEAYARLARRLVDQGMA